MFATSLTVYDDASKELVPRELLPSALWRGVSRLCTLARHAEESRDVPARHHCLMSAQRIVAAMDGALRDEVLPDSMAKGLHDLHYQILRTLERANLLASVDLMRLAGDNAYEIAAAWEAAAHEAGPQVRERWEH